MKQLNTLLIIPVLSVLFLSSCTSQSPVQVQSKAKTSLTDPNGDTGDPDPTGTPSPTPTSSPSPTPTPSPSPTPSSSPTPANLSPMTTSSSVQVWSLIKNRSNPHVCYTVASTSDDPAEVITSPCDSVTISSKNFLFYLDPRNGEIVVDRLGKGFQCLGVLNASKSPEANIIVFPCGENPDHKWELISENRIRNIHSQLCLGSNGTKLVQQDCASSGVKDWELVSPSNEGQWSFLKLQSDEKNCLGVNDGSSSGAKVVSRECRQASMSQKNFYWKPEIVSGNTFYLKTDTQNGDGIQCLDVPGGSKKDGEALVVWSCHGGNNQRFTLTPESRIKNVNSGLCLAQVDSDQGPTLVQKACSTASNMKWKFVSASTPSPWKTLRKKADLNTCFIVESGASDGVKTLSFPCSLINPLKKDFLWYYDQTTGEIKTDTANGNGVQCLAIPNGSKQAHVEAIIWPCGGQTDQKWDLLQSGLVKNRASGLCLVHSDDRLKQYTCSDKDDAMRFQLVREKFLFGTKLLKNRTASLTLEMSNPNSKDHDFVMGTRFSHELITGRYWYLDPNTQELRTLGKNGDLRCADVAGGDTSAGAKLIHFQCHGGDNQKWELTRDQQLKNKNSDLCLTPFGFSYDTSEQIIWIQQSCSQTSTRTKFWLE